MRIFLLSLFLLPLTGCLFRSHQVERKPAAVTREASLADLLREINSQSASIKTMQATVDISTSVGGEKKGKVIEYPEISGYVLIRKPLMLRMIGLVPLVRSRLFDMVSDGKQFKLSIPGKNKFVIGRDDVIKPSNQPLENLRPRHIMEALLLREIDPASEIAVLQQSTEKVPTGRGKKEIEVPDYQVLVIRRVGETWYLSRKVIFSRVDLLPHSQVVYDQKGGIVTEASYENFANYDGMKFPSIIEITRPQEEYSIQLAIVKLRINRPLADDQFVLQQPAGSQLQDLDLELGGGPGSPAKARR